MILPGVSPTERLFSPQTVCVWASGVYIARALLGNSVPNTKEEVLALAADSGVPGGASGNYSKLKAGMQKRYGLVGESFTSVNSPAARAAVLTAAEKGPIAAAVAGDQYNLEPRWQNGHIGHSIAVLYENGTNIGLQLDPLAPAGYGGDQFPPSELEKYATAALIFKEEVMVITQEKFNPERVWRLAAPATIAGYSIDLATGFIKQVSTHTWDKSSTAHADAQLTRNGKVYIHVSDGAYAGQYISSPNAVLDPVAPLFTKEQLAAAEKQAALKVAKAASQAAATI